MLFTVVFIGGYGKISQSLLEVEVEKKEKLPRLSEASDSVLLLAAHAPSYFQRPDVVPFLRPLECYAKQQNMRFTLRAGPWPLVHENVAKIELVSWYI